MKGRKCIASLLVVASLICLPAIAQVITKEALAKYKDWPRFGEIALFYQLNQGKLAWVKDSSQQRELMEVLKCASAVGLNEAEYQNDFVRSFSIEQNLHTALDSIDADIRFTDDVFHFFIEVKNGKVPSFGYTGLNYKPDVSALPSQLHQYLQQKNLKSLFNELQPRSREYAVARDKLNWFLKIINEPDFKETRIVSVKVDSSNKPLLVRLYQLGFGDSIESVPSKRGLVTKIQLAQQEFDLLSDGELRNTTLQALNTTLFQRIEELKTALNTFRWLEDIKQDSSVLLLNIPAANFFLYEKGKIMLESRVVVGKKSTPTPSLTSTITEVILYPYWTVPQKIATRELLPLIKKNIGFLKWGNYQVLDKRGRVLDPYSINWQSLNGSNFPYVIRQSTGCDNALGLVKFNLYNPFSVYLHDTPVKMFFASARRFYSHGCMRVEKPGELAHYILGNNRVAYDTLTAKGCIYQQSPIVVQPEKKLPVIILYSTVWYNTKGEIRFYDDVYNKPNSTTGKLVNR
ncbi:MAG: hypothetical protein EON98_00115 [Chitinophagaceae bacterium]|nr:MAG: hypothetical protein EON98_00115 [Chitinophagaceae bacterium]